MSRVYALLVGINDYVDGVSKLHGCLNDIDNASEYLNEQCRDPAILVLKDAEATRVNVIEGIRRHLAQAGPGDVAYLQFCGHGARSRSAPEFGEFDLERRDTGLVLYDSRRSDQTFDLADKELALLIDELARRGPHISLMFDCCHAGSGTRSDEADEGVNVRTARPSQFPPRPLETYLEGQYSALHARGELAIPIAPHMLLAACDRSQTAKESVVEHRGFYTTSFYDVLRKSGGTVSYAELFVRARAAVRQLVRELGKSDQDPQFEAIGGFDAYAGFLSSDAAKARRRYMLVDAGQGWRVECGAVQGLSTDPARAAAFAISAEGDEGERLGTARVVSVGAQTSAVALDFAADPAVRYQAEAISIPQPPLIVGFAGDEALRPPIEAALRADPAGTAMLGDGDDADDDFVLTAGNGVVRLTERGRDGTIRQVPVSEDGTGWAAPLIAALAHLAQWRRSLALRNPHPQLDPEQVDLLVTERRPGAPDQLHAGPAVTLVATETGPKGPQVKSRLQLRNRTGQLLHFALFHFTGEHAVKLHNNGQIVSGKEAMTILEPRFSIPQGTSATERLKLICSTEPIDDFLLVLPPLRNDRDMDVDEPGEAKKPVTDDWFTRDLTVQVVRGETRIGAAPTTLAGGRITIAPHASLSATVALTSTAGGGSRSAGAEGAAARLLLASGLLPASLDGGSRDTEGAAVLVLGDIVHAEALEDEPLALRLDVPLGEREVLVPLFQAGGRMIVAGETWRDEDGATQLRIAHLPNGGDERNLVQTAKLFLFKAVLNAGDVDLLRQVVFSEASRPEWRRSGIVEAVAAADRVLLLLHGIAGGSEPMAAGVHAAGLDGQFGCVLAYDYESLSTPIEDTARLLKAALAGVGLQDGSGKRLTILAHSTGGLVARWLVEREGGAAFIDHVVLCGTPNAGSPLGRVGQARSVAQMLATLGLTMGMPVCGPVLAVLGYSSKLTPSLEQTAANSSLMKALALSERPAGTRYTIVAGDACDYEAQSGSGLSEALLAVGQGSLVGSLFSGEANDIAVARESAHGAGARALAGAERRDIACHHLGYFSAPEALGALRAIE